MYAMANHPLDSYIEYGGLDAFSLQHDLLVLADGSGGITEGKPDNDK